MPKKTTKRNISAALPLIAQARENILQFFDHFRAGLPYAMDAGDQLRKAKKIVGHGRWLTYLQKNSDIHERTAQKMMRAARHRPKIEEQIRLGKSDLTLDGALELVANETPKNPSSANRVTKRTTAKAPTKGTHGVASHVHRDDQEVPDDERHADGNPEDALTATVLPGDGEEGKAGADLRPTLLLPAPDSVTELASGSIEQPHDGDELSRAFSHMIQEDCFVAAATGRLLDHAAQEAAAMRELSGVGPEWTQERLAWALLVRAVAIANVDKSGAA